MLLCPLKRQPLKFFAKLHKSPLLIASIVKVTASGLRKYLRNESPRKITENAFYFILTNYICCWQIKFCSYYAFWLGQLWSLKILAIKRWFLFNFAIILQGRHFLVDEPKYFKLLADISFESGLQNIVLLSLLLFRVLVVKLMNWSSNFDGP